MFFWASRLHSCGQCTLGRERVSIIIMIWHWAIFSRGFIFFSRLIFFGWVIFSSLSLGLPQAVRAAGVTGEVELTNSKDAAVRKRKDYSGVVLWLEPVERAVPPSGNGRRVEMLQKDKHFLPHVLAIHVGARWTSPMPTPSITTPSRTSAASRSTWVFIRPALPRASPSSTRAWCGSSVTFIPP